MKQYLIYVVLYFLLMLTISVSFEAFVWKDEAINQAYLLKQCGTALIWALIMALAHTIYKKARQRERW